jgi:NAD(P)H-nitrite reductase large subunit
LFSAALVIDACKKADTITAVTSTTKTGGSTGSCDQVIGETLLSSKENNPENRQHKNDNKCMIALQPGLSNIQYRQINAMNGHT